MSYIGIVNIVMVKYVTHRHTKNSVFLKTETAEDKEHKIIVFFLFYVLEPIQFSGICLILIMLLTFVGVLVL